MIEQAGDSTNFHQLTMIGFPVGDLPYKGRISHWEKVECEASKKGLPFYVLGHFLDHPDIPPGRRTNTSGVMAAVWCSDGSGEIATRNSRYTLLARTADAPERSTSKHPALAAPYGEKTEGTKLGELAVFLGARELEIGQACKAMTRFSHGVSKARGWHDKPREDGTAIALMHSELSEALEGIRKDTMDDHIPIRKTVEVELADLLHRVFDFAGARGLDLGGAYIEKGLYNISRKDHSAEARAQAGGKKF